MSLVVATLTEMYLGFDVTIWPVLIAVPTFVLLAVAYLIWVELIKKKK
jgi:hypothetical protein